MGGGGAILMCGVATQWTAAAAMGDGGEKATQREMVMVAAHGGDGEMDGGMTARLRCATSRLL